MTQRQVRIANVIKKEVAKSFSKGISKNPLISLINISDVWVSPDLRLASVYITSLQQNVDRKELENALNSESYMYRKELAKNITSKYTPALTFYFDDTSERASKMDALIKSSNTQSE